MGTNLPVAILRLAVFSFFAKTEREWVNEREFVENTDDMRN